MNLPNFTAERSLYVKDTAYHAVSGITEDSTMQTVIPQGKQLCRNKWVGWGPFGHCERQCWNGNGWYTLYFLNVWECW